ncbi:MAG: 23S rRNA (uracil(1939)-C(5))-methyltransferase RlmD [Steroidobacteraceae bacterium]
MARPLNITDTASIVDLAEDGRGIARHGGKTVFVDGALPGERVRYRLVRRRSQFDEAALEEVLEPSPHRVRPACPHFGLCGGCSLQHLDAAAQLDVKQGQLLNALERIGGVRPREVLAPLRGPPWAYRRRARLGVRHVRKKQRVLAGFRERLSPYLADLSSCEVLVAPLKDLPAELARLVGGMDLKEGIPQVEVAAGDAAIALVFRVMSEPGEADLQRLREFGSRLGVEVYLQPGGLDSVRALGPATPLSYLVSSEQVRIGFLPTDFVQVNAAINTAMVDQALHWLDPGPADRVLDLFCGLGNFSLPVARRCAGVVAVEGDAGLIARARQNAALNGIGNVEYHVQDLFDPAGFGAWADQRFERVLLDPPRAGAAQVMERMSRWAPERVVYISCHPGTLARDTRILTEGLRFELAAAGVMDMFPHTTHVESIAVFKRRV